MIGSFNIHGKPIPTAKRFKNGQRDEGWNKMGVWVLHDAIATSKRAIALASQKGQTNLAQRNQELMALYLNHQPYREPK